MTSRRGDLPRIPSRGRLGRQASSKRTRKALRPTSPEALAGARAPPVPEAKLDRIRVARSLTDDSREFAPLEGDDDMHGSGRPMRRSPSARSGSSRGLGRQRSNKSLGRASSHGRRSPPTHHDAASPIRSDGGGSLHRVGSHHSQFGSRGHPAGALEGDMSIMSEPPPRRGSPDAFDGGTLPHGSGSPVHSHLDSIGSTGGPGGSLTHLAVDPSEASGCGIPKDRFVGSVPKAFCCTICLNVLNDPVETPCQHVFCRSGLEDWVAGGNTSCPSCGRNVALSQLRKPSPTILDFHSSLKLRCANWQAGCRYADGLGAMIVHEQSCAFTSEECPNDGCGVAVLRKDFERHVASCAFAMQTCDKCGKTMSRAEYHAHSCALDTMKQLIESVSKMMDKMTQLEDFVRESETRVDARMVAVETQMLELRKSVEPRVEFIFNENTRMGAIFRLRSHVGKYVRAKPNTMAYGAAAELPSAKWTCCGQAEFECWCPARRMEDFLEDEDDDVRASRGSKNFRERAGAGSSRRIDSSGSTSPRRGRQVSPRQSARSLKKRDSSRRGDVADSETKSRSKSPVVAKLKSLGGLFGSSKKAT